MLSQSGQGWTATVQGAQELDLWGQQAAQLARLLGVPHVTRRNMQSRQGCTASVWGAQQLDNARSPSCSGSLAELLGLCESPVVTRPATCSPGKDVEPLCRVRSNWTMQRGQAAQAAWLSCIVQLLRTLHSISSSLPTLPVAAWLSCFASARVQLLLAATCSPGKDVEPLCRVRSNRTTRECQAAQSAWLSCLASARVQLSLALQQAVWARMESHCAGCATGGLQRRPRCSVSLAELLGLLGTPLVAHPATGSLGTNAEQLCRRLRNWWTLEDNGLLNKLSCLAWESTCCLHATGSLSQDEGPLCRVRIKWTAEGDSCTEGQLRGQLLRDCPQLLGRPRLKVPAQTAACIMQPPLMEVVTDH